MSLLRKGKRLVINLDKCIGCEACANVCSPGFITIGDEGLRRTLRFPIVCREDCTRCADACSERAITFAAPSVLPTRKYSTATFDLAPCEGCGNPFTTQRIVDKLMVAVAKETGATPEGLTWLRMCPLCRQAHERGKVAREVKGLL